MYEQKSFDKWGWAVKIFNTYGEGWKVIYMYIVHLTFWVGDAAALAQLSVHPVKTQTRNNVAPYFWAVVDRSLALSSSKYGMPSDIPTSTFWTLGSSPSAGVKIWLKKICTESISENSPPLYGTLPMADNSGSLTVYLQKTHTKTKWILVYKTN